MSDGDLGTRKTLFVLVIVVGCFAVLWPKVFYPMLVGPTNQRMKPNSLDKGCCDVISDVDINTIKIMSELCNNIVQQTDDKPLKGQEIITMCRTKILDECGIDISSILQEQVRLGRPFKQIVDEIRSYNGSLCLKYKFGISPSQLGVAHRVAINLSPVYIRQERPAHLRPEMLHPALKEKGRAIVQPYQSPKSVQPKFMEGRPGPVPGVRPPMGGAGHVHTQKSTNSMGVIMPIYTIGIVVFFSYTLMKLLFKKKPEGPGAPLYPPVEPSMTFRKEVFESQRSRCNQGPPSIVNAMTALLDEVDQELEARRNASQVASQKESPADTTVLPNGDAKQVQEQDGPSVKVLGMEMTASCEGGQKWSRPESPVIPKSSQPSSEPIEPPQEIYLEGILPAHSQILVADSTVEEEPNSNSSSADPAVILASKMTLSVISLDSQESENGNDIVDKIKLQNGSLVDNELEIIDDVIEESKYTTASGATAAERDISEDEQTDDENDIEEIEKVPDFVMDNGVQQITGEDEVELDLIDDLEVDGEMKFQDKDNDKTVENNNTSDKIQIPEVRISAEESDEKPIISPEAIESIVNVIDDVISAGTRMSELISAERDIDSEEIKQAIKLETENIDNTLKKDNLDNVAENRTVSKNIDTQINSDEELEVEEEEVEVEEEEVEVEEIEEIEEEEVEVEEVEEDEEEDVISKEKKPDNLVLL